MEATLTSSSFFGFFAQSYHYREYLKQSVLRDLRTKYKRSVLGYVWTMLHPLAMMTVLAIVFSGIMKLDDYAVFLFTGLIPWNYFNSTSLMSLHTIRSNARIFGQVPVPKYIFVVSLLCSNLTNLLFSIIPLLLLMIFFGRPIQPAVLAFPIILLPLICVVLSVSLLFAASNVFFDDTLHLAEVGMQALYFLCPVLYKRDMLPPHISEYLALNPLAFQIESFRGLFYSGTFPDPYLFIANFAFSLILLIISLRIFNRVQDRFLYFV